nr:AAA family ATPase [Frigoribacterium sp. CFBP 8766]
MAADHLSIPVDEGTWAEQMALEDDELDWHIQGLAFVGANILLNALAKSGKTTLVLNVIRCLLSGDSLFGRFAVEQLRPGRRVAWWNAELVSGQAREWLRSMDIPNPDSLALWHLRGHHVPLELHEGEEAAVAWLRKYNVSVWVLDPKSALFRGEENSATETGAWLSAIDRIKQRAGVDTVFLVHHASEPSAHDSPDDSANRFLKGRGSSRTEGWADVIWSWTGRFEEPRYLAALGRDVDQPLIGGMLMNPLTRLLTWDGGTTSPNEDRRHRLMLVAHAALMKADSPVQMGVLEGQMPGSKKDPKRDAINYGVSKGYIEQWAGPSHTKLHKPGPVDPHADSVASANVTWHRPSDPA